MKRFFTFLMVFSLLIPFSHADAQETINVEAGSAILYNPATKEILYEKNADAIIAPASLTKVMTLLLVSEEMKKRGTDPKTLVTISEQAWKTDGSRMFLNVGAQVPIHDLIEGLAIVSGNDAAVSLAEYFYGSTDQFVEAMNKRAKAIGMTNTKFTTVNGLSERKDGDKSTARDLMLLTDYYLTHFPENLAIHKKTTFVTLKAYHGGATDITQNTRNPLLGSYKGGTGLKTGMIEDTFNLIGTAQRDNIPLISVIMDAKSSGARTRAAFTLLDYGFSQYETVIEGEKGEEVQTIKVYKSKGTKSTTLYLKEEASFVVNIKDKESIEVKDKLPKYLEGGFAKGDKVGERIITAGDKTYTYDIIVTETIKEAPWYIKLLDEIAILFNKLINLL